MTQTAKFARLAGVLLALFLCARAYAEDIFHAGPLFDSFNLTLEPGYRTEMLGPLFYDEHSESQRLWAVPPLLTYSQTPATELKELDFLYPVMTYDRYGAQYRWQFCQILSFSGGPSQNADVKSRFTLFPIYFQQRSSNPAYDYTALFPIYGHIQHRLFRDEIFFVLFPFYSRTWKKDVVTDNYLVPIFHLRRGDGLSGWQFWPLAGREEKVVTMRTNGFGDLQTSAGHQYFFMLWPLFFNDRTGLGTTNLAHQQSSLPAYSFLRSPARDDTTVLWPLFTITDDREKGYHEWAAPWPFVDFARGPGKTTSRVWPFFGQARNAELESDFYAWPIFKYNRARKETLDRERARICFFLYSDITDKNKETGKERRRVDFWPFFSYHRDFDGNSRLHSLALIESFTAGSHKIERDYSPVWSIWRSENNPTTKATSQSLLWNLYRRETRADSKKGSLLFGLFQYQSSSEGKTVRLFYIPIVNTKHAASTKN